MQVSRSHISVVACCLFLLFAIVAYVSRWFAYRLNCNAGPLILRENSRRMNTYDANISKRLAELVERKATVSDPDLIQVIRDMMDPPSKHIPKMSRVLEATPQSNEIDMLYAQKTNGFYIECGAFDGEQMSNTIFLELARQWTGLLVEMDPYFYSQLLAKSRNSWSINACLSPKPYVTQVLRTIPFEKVTIPTLSVEHRHIRGGKKSCVQFMQTKGYKVHKNINVFTRTLAVFDYIFVKQ